MNYRELFPSLIPGGMGQITKAPERGNENTNWFVSDNTGLEQVLQSGEFINYLSENPEKHFAVFFEGGTAADLSGDGNENLFNLLSEINKDFVVEVFPLSFSAHYERWNGQRKFDVVSISLKN
jgi:hypothetical protein